MFRERAASPTLSRFDVPQPRAGSAIQRILAPVQPLLAPFAGAWLIYVALGALLQSRALQVYAAGYFSSSDFLRSAAYALTPDALITASRQSATGVLVLLIYAGMAGLALAAWCWAIRIARSLELHSLTPVLLLTTLLALPLIASTGLFSDDVYLYNIYGRAIADYGANPIVKSPSAFMHDPHIWWVHWKELPSSYGPLWLMLSAPLSAISGDSISAVVLVYRCAALALHLLVAGAIWYVLRRTRHREALAGTIFYAWNPLVLVEVVGNAHNDVLVGLFAVLLVGAITQRAWASAAFFCACAVMVKSFAVLLLPPLALRIANATRGTRRIRAFAAALAAGALTIAALSLPLWAGTQLMTNISSNPASHAYTNTIWELISQIGPAWFGIDAARIQHPYLDAIRMACFLTGALWVLTRPWARRNAAQAAFALWVIFSLTASWVWPWYFVPAIALSVFAGRGAIALGTAMTMGGLLFWATWSPPPFSAMHTWRSLLLFGPAVVTLAWPSLRAAVLNVLGSARVAEPVDEDALRIRLQTAPG